MREKEEWMEFSQEDINNLSEDDWEHYKNGGCLCMAYSRSECICGSWWRE